MMWPDNPMAMFSLLHLHCCKMCSRPMRGYVRSCVKNKAFWKPLCRAAAGRGQQKHPHREYMSSLLKTVRSHFQIKKRKKKKYNVTTCYQGTSCYSWRMVLFQESSVGLCCCWVKYSVEAVDKSIFMDDKPCFKLMHSFHPSFLPLWLFVSWAHCAKGDQWQKLVDINCVLLYLLHSFVILLPWILCGAH